MDAPIQKFSVGGLKLSLELVQFRLLPNAGLTITGMLRRLADKQINLLGVSLDETEGPLTGTCTLSAEDRFKAIEALEPFNRSFEITSPVGSLTIFPIQSRINLVGGLLSAMGASGLPVLGFASSLSSLTIITDYHRLDEAVNAVCRVITLPENHAPFRPEFRVKQL